MSRIGMSGASCRAERSFGIPFEQLGARQRGWRQMTHRIKGAATQCSFSETYCLIVASSPSVDHRSHCWDFGPEHELCYWSNNGELSPQATKRENALANWHERDLVAAAGRDLLS
jgi:hypothetical protein